MIPFLSPEWIAELDAAARQCPLPTAMADEVALVVQQVVELAGGEKVRYHLVVGGEGLRVRPGRADSPDVTVTQPYAVAAAISRGELSAQAAIVAGDLRLTGDLESLVRHARALAGVEDVFARVRDVTRY